MKHIKLKKGERETYWDNNYRGMYIGVTEKGRKGNRLG
jgi:hypothetical protein